MSVQAKCIAVFGGAFDPFHSGHVAAITLLLSVPHVERVVVVPSGDRPDKQGVSPAADRFEMTRRGVEAAFPGESRVLVTDVQSRGAVGFATIDLVTYIHDRFGMEAGVVIGHELLHDLPKWHRADELKQRARFLVLERPGAGAAAPIPGWRVEFLPPFGALSVEVSSTELRQRLARGERCEGLMPEVVREYCAHKGLYRI
jgi:nicotinate-nucleotide adenylyltransferase